jgi:hypothetical protein
MSHPFDVSPTLQKTLNKLGRKDRNLAITVRKKGDIFIFEDFDHHDRIYRTR